MLDLGSTKPMAYFIVQAPYDKGFDLFFKDELGYPNFYRMTELLSLPPQDKMLFENVILLVPFQCKTPEIIQKILQKMDQMSIKYYLFGENLETDFNFDEQGQLIIHPLFKQALDQALSEFLATPSQAKSA